MDIYKQICAKLVEAWDNTADGEYEDFGRAASYLVDWTRAELAEPQPDGPTLDEIDDLCAEHSFCYEDSESLECLLLIITDALARWGK